MKLYVTDQLKPHLPKCHEFLVVCSSVIVCLVWAPLVPAQSIAVQVPTSQSGNLNSGVSVGSARVVNTTTWPPNSLSAPMRAWESILDRSFPSQFNRPSSANQMVAHLNRIGLPIVLYPSAKDDSLPENEPVELPLKNSSLRSRLLVGLGEKNATIAFFENHIAIISMDDMDRPTQNSVSYDVTRLGTDPYDLIDTITITVDPDSWEDNGGEATIVPSTINGRKLITVASSYTTQRQVLQLLQGMYGLAGSRLPGRRAIRSESQPVAVPKPPGPQTLGGGGFFNVPSQSIQPSR